jgi:tryptophan synthase alpha chain
MNRIDSKFRELKKANRKALIAYITAGDPNLKVTEDLAVSFESAGVDIIELGIPFSDPMADGTTIQAASKRALDRGITLSKIFETVKNIRRKTQIPMAFMTYYNPVFCYGEDKFIAKCKEIGIDGLIIPDLPPEEASHLRAIAKKAGIAVIFFIAPTSEDSRIKANSAASTGFVYYVALTGVTGTKQADSSQVVKHIRHAKKFTSQPVCAGFGISTAQQVKDISKAADGVIIGSAIIKEIEKQAGKSDLVKQVCKFVSSLSAALK